MGSLLRCLLLPFIIVVLLAFVVMSSPAGAESIDTDLAIHDLVEYGNTTVVQNGSISVRNGGSLVIDNCTWTINAPIYVDGGGTLNIVNSEVVFIPSYTGIYVNTSARVNIIGTSIDSPNYPYYYTYVFSIMVRSSDVVFKGIEFIHPSINLDWIGVNGGVIKDSSTNSKWSFDIIDCRDIQIVNVSFLSPPERYPPSGDLYTGLLISNSTGITVTDSVFENHHSFSLKCIDSQYIQLTGNRIFGNRTQSDEISGIVLTGCRNITVKDTRLHRTTQNAMLVESSSNVNIVGSIMEYNRVALSVTDSDDVEIKANRFFYNDHGISMQGSRDCYTHLNTFLGNKVDALDDNGNEWDLDGYGNQWDRYQGSDSNHDGIGDSPHSVPSSSEDRYPLMFPYDMESLVLIGIEPEDGAVNVDLDAIFVLRFNLPVREDTVIDSISTDPQVGLKLISTSMTMDSWYVIVGPVSPWSEDTEYHVTINRTIRDVFDRSLDRRYHLNFSTSDLTAPGISLISPDNSSWIYPGTPIVLEVDDGDLAKVTVTIGPDQTTYNMGDINLDTTDWPDGPMEIVVSAIDRSGNERSRMFYFLLDGAKPSITSVSPVNGSYLGIDDTIIIEVEDISPVVMEMTIGMERYISNTILLEIPITDLPEGQIEAYLIVTDSVDNTASMSLTYMIDRLRPTISLMGPEHGAILTIGDEMNLLVVDNSLQLVELRAGTGPWEQIDALSGQVYNHVVGPAIDGALSIDIRATDMAVNMNSTTFWFLLDQTPPVISYNLKELPSSLNPNTTLEFTIIDDHLMEVVVLLDDEVIQKGAFSSFSLSMTYLSFACHTIELEALDVVGLSSTLVLAIDVDGASPMIEISLPRNGPFVSHKDHIGVEVIDAHLNLVTITIDGDILKRTSEPSLDVPLLGISHGWHNVSVLAIDSADNYGIERTEFFMDRRPPIIIPSSFSDKDVLRPGQPIVFSVEDDSGIHSFVLSIDGGDPTGPDPTYLFFIPIDIADGNHTITISGTDIVGNSAEYHYSFRVRNEVKEEATYPLLIILVCIALVAIGVVAWFIRGRERD